MLVPSLEIQHHPSHLVVRLKGCDKLGDHNIEAVGRQLNPLVEESPLSTLHLDLAEVSSVTSVVLGKFISLNRKLRSTGSRLVLKNVNNFIQETLAVTRLDQLLTVLPAVN